MRDFLAWTPLIILVALIVAPAATRICTVDNTGVLAAPDYADLGAALAGCRGTYPDLVVSLRMLGNYSLAGLVVPNHISLLAFQSYSGSAADVVFTEVGLAQDTVDFAARPAVSFQNVSLQLDGSTQPLFLDTLVNQNFTMNGCVINGSAAYPFFITQEVRRNDTVVFTFKRNVINNLQYGLMNLTGLSDYLITNNDCESCGTKLPIGSSVVYLKQSDVQGFSRIYSYNAHH